MNKISTRIISALVAIPILILFVVIGGILFKIGVLGITAIAIYEYLNAYKNTGHKVILFPIAAGYLINSFLLLRDINSLGDAIIFIILLMSMAYPIFSKKYNVLSSALTVTGYIYIVVFFSMLVHIRDYSYGNRLIWIIFIIAFSSDTLAYFTGRSFGKRKLCPDVSPKKTVEGSIGGVLGSIIGICIWAYFNKDIPFQWYQIVILGAVGSIISQIGDLSASLIKRFVGIKDYGNLMPGHGGVLDRFDSILFTTPVVYYYIVLFLG